MPDAGVDGLHLRLYLFRPVRPTFDAITRYEILPALARCPGVLGVWAGRKGPDEMGRRVVASLGRPIMTRHIEDLAAFHADHFELLPTDPPVLPPGEPRQTARRVDRSSR